MKALKFTFYWVWIFFFFASARPAFAGDPLKILILTAPFGAGHDTAAARTKEEILRLCPNCQVVIKNSQDFMLKPVRNFSQWISDYTQKNQPGIYTKFYENYLQKGREAKSVADMPNEKLFVPSRYIQYLDKEHFDSVVASWPIIIELNEKMRQKGLFKDLPFSWIETDLVSEGGKNLGYYEKLAMAVDHAFLPSESVKKDFVAAGVPAEKLSVSGMPLKLENRAPLTLEQRVERQKEARIRLGLNQGAKTIMLEGGKNGVGNFPLMIGSILHEIPDEKLTLIAATGQNSELLDWVTSLVNGVGKDRGKERLLYGKMKPLLAKGVTEQELLGWIHNGLPKDRITLKPLAFVPLKDWRLAADVVVTKPGGLSTAEMAADGVPMILQSKIASGEALYNVRYFVNAGLAVENKEEASVGAQAKSVLGNKNFLLNLYQQSELFRKSNNTSLIADWAIQSAKAARGRVPSRVPIPAEPCPKIFACFE